MFFLKVDSMPHEDQRVSEKHCHGKAYPWDTKEVVIACIKRFEGLTGKYWLGRAIPPKGVMVKRVST